MDSEHPDLEDDLVSGYDSVDEDYTTDPYYDWAHGTCCAGLAAASTNNNLGIAGVGYNCKIMPLQASHDEDLSNSSNFAAAINWAWNHGADIISISAYTTTADAVNNAINSATSSGRSGKGCIVVNCAGNDNGSIVFPGQHPKVLTVGATDQNDSRMSYSNYGSALNVMAPTNVYTTDMTGEAGKTLSDYYNSFGGTSAATPQVAGLAGLILSVDNSLDEGEVRDIICYTSDDKGSPGWDQYYGWGRINAYSAVKCANGNFTTSGTMQYSEYWHDTVNLTGNLTVPTGKYLYISDNTTVNLNGYYIYCSGTGRIYHNGTVNGYKHYSTYTSSYYTGFYPSSVSIQQIINWASSGWNIYIDSGTYSGTLSMKAGVDIYGTGITSTIINGGTNFNNDDGAGLSDVTVKDKITVNNSDGVVISSFKAGHSNCYIDLASSSMLGLGSITSLVTQTQGIYAHSGSDFSLISGSLKNKMDAVQLSGSSNGDIYWGGFCQNSYYDIIAFSSCAHAYGCTFSSSVPGGSVSGNVYWDNWNYCGGGGGFLAVNQTIRQTMC